MCRAAILQAAVLPPCQNIGVGRFRAATPLKQTRPRRQLKRFTVEQHCSLVLKRCPRRKTFTCVSRNLTQTCVWLCLAASASFGHAVGRVGRVLGRDIILDGAEHESLKILQRPLSIFQPGSSRQPSQRNRH